MNSEVLSLNKEQQKAFNRMKRAYNDCKKLGIIFANRYGNLYAYDRSLICSFGDSTVEAPEAVSEVSVMDLDGGDYISIPNEWTDDDNYHYYGLTEKGHKIYFEEQ